MLFNYIFYKMLSKYVYCYSFPSPYSLPKSFALLTRAILSHNLFPNLLPVSVSLAFYYLFECANGAEICYLIIGLRDRGMNKHESAGAGSSK